MYVMFLGLCFTPLNFIMMDCIDGSQQICTIEKMCGISFGLDVTCWYFDLDFYKHSGSVVRISRKSIHVYVLRCKVPSQLMNCNVSCYLNTVTTVEPSFISMLDFE